tara:strand:- start:7071 stop:7571 length:501 start_codon:yes stop_codon:yes gene_type:complete
MQLTEDQQQKVRQWASEGADLGNIQKRLAEELEITISFMETRFLISDLNITLHEEVEEEPEEPAVSDQATEGPVGEEGGLGAKDDPEEPSLGGPGEVSVSLDTIAQPGMMASGKATFSDGETAVWYIDEMGRLGMDATTPGYRPAEADLMKFQEELGKAARKAGLA